MSTYDEIESDSETDMIVKVISKNQSNHDDTDIHASYVNRQRLENSGRMLFSNPGTYLAISADEPGSTVDNPISVALTLCKEKVLKPYSYLLLTVGWQPVFDVPNNICKQMTNILYPIVVVILICLGYVIQYAACFRRDGAGIELVSPVIPLLPTNSTSSPQGNWPPCQHYIISQYLIPDMLHSVAYGYSFYFLRIKMSEQLPTLTERVFLQASPTLTGFRSQGKLIKKLRTLLYGTVAWVTLSQIAQVIHIIAEYKNINFYWLEPSSEVGRILMLIVMFISFMALDIVYSAVVINYCVQCFLLIFYIERIKEKIRERSLEILPAMKEIEEVRSHIRILNNHPGMAVSLVMINFGTMATLGTLALVNPDNTKQSTEMYVATAMAVLLWFSLMLLTIIAGTILTSKSKSLQKIGHEVQIRPFGFEDISDEQLNSFLLYMSTLNMRAKIFLISVETSRVCAVGLLIGMTLLLLFQTGILHIWL